MVHRNGIVIPTLPQLPAVADGDGRGGNVQTFAGMPRSDSECCAWDEGHLTALQLTDKLERVLVGLEADILVVHNHKMVANLHARLICLAVRVDLRDDHPFARRKILEVDPVACRRLVDPYGDQPSGQRVGFPPLLGAHRLSRQRRNCSPNLHLQSCYGSIPVP
eukprot:CAMPEP_0179996744 /NCGR_PEP_ID=MMETSP0984-20121128/7767_1 /TAXON_ID=483367 /ORGANISM="non described non described, Strain CCMP 2436" /LENGTH=163 /DNA_ID=CAMNT_0021916293 /DNA_START=107 /DNA_END=595 /DNA_ORIENTATION=-